jgi:hypothetical protein
MKTKKLLLWLAVWAWLIPCLPASSVAAITVYFSPLDSVVPVGETFTVDLMADLSTAAVLGWGLDVSFDPAVVAMAEPPEIGPLWDPPFFTMDHDGLAGLAFPTPVTGNGILLATLKLETVGQGFSDLIASATFGDLTEGFPLATGGFAQVNYTPGSVTAAPVPGALLLLGSGLAGLLGIRRKARK